jgi:transcriptional regulator with XRE-family HTH domain
MTLSNVVGNVYYMVPKPKSKIDLRHQTDAQRLRALFEMRKAQEGITQDTAAEAMGIKQTMVSHYLSGRKPMGTEALLRWARFLRVSPLDISPDFEYRDMIPGSLSPPQIEVAILWAELPEDIGKNVREQIKSTVRAVKSR